MSRILTTHVGSLPRPHALLDAMKAKLAGNTPADYDRKVRGAIVDRVRQQVEVGIDIVSDGEQSAKRRELLKAMAGGGAMRFVKLRVGLSGT